MKTTKFIIVCIQRSGSTWLTTLLNSHPDICCAEETFLLSKKNMCPMAMRKKIWPHKLGYPRYINSSIKRCLKHHFLRTKLINEYLNQFYSMPDYSAIGFKIMLNQIEKFSTMSDYFFKNDVKVIHLVRDNILKTFISRISVSQKKVAHTQKKLKFTKIYIPTEKIETKLQKIKNDNKALEKLFFNRNII
ncbi:MAG TPA: hypothetical protein DD405_00830 [Desulfobacteraceae bacterium]|nr:hypothetical protein [Desulfobacteraceae bacterium]